MRAVAGNSNEPGVSVAQRLLAVLACFDAAHPRLSLSDIARRAELPLSTAHRFTGELVAWGALTRDDDGIFGVGRRLWDIGLLAPVQRGLRELAAPHLQDIHAATRETVHFAVRDADRALYLERISGNRSVHVVSHVGARLPLHTTGVGKVLLAHAPPDVVATVLDDLTRETCYSIVDPRRLLRQLAETRRRGYARTNEEMTLGTCSVAVPVRDRGDRVVAAVGIVVPSVRRDLPRLVPALQVAAAAISRRLEPDAVFH
jgi:DNA-binding IclR family transcriptional regulator